MTEEEPVDFVEVGTGREFNFDGGSEFRAGWKDGIEPRLRKLSRDGAWELLRLVYSGPMTPSQFVTTSKKLSGLGT